MSSILSSLLRRIVGRTRPAIPAPPASTSYTGPSVTRRKGANFDITTFEEGDRVILNGKKALLTTPLKANGRTKTGKGYILHRDIIGKQIREGVRSDQNAAFRATYPTLEQYVTLSGRLVTPVYPADASLIVSLLDIHVSPPGGTSQGPVEILEAGTGHGSLTLHLARAVHAANTAPPFLPPRQRPADPSKAKENVEGPEFGLDADDVAALRAWREQRGAIVHTVDVSTGYSVHAESIVRGFRRGMYAGDVDFYVSPVEKWIEEQVQRRESDKPFLQYAILDLPGAQDRISHVSPILKEDGVLAVFMPSITQIGECLQLVNELRLPLILEKAVELGTGISSGRLWDVRSAMIRKPSLEPCVSHTDAGEKVEEAEEAQEPGPEEDTEAEGTSAPKGKSVLVCRPKVGERIVGGGFVGIWRKIKR